ncbi:MAG TPA: hypothetical protein VF705_05965, partial [Longimicrobium sp.]
TLEETNDFAGRVYGAMSVTGDRTARQLDYFVTKTVLRAREYGHAADPILNALGFTYEDYERAGGVSVIRCTVMDPFLGSRRGRMDFIGGFAKTLRSVLESVL